MQQLPCIEIDSKFTNEFRASRRNPIVSAKTVVSYSVLYFICQSCWTLEVTQNLATKNQNLNSFAFPNIM
jgi:hypothetical protein